MQTKKLYRSNTNRIITGVCGGIGEYFGVDPIIIRVLFIVLTFLGFSGVFIYLVSSLIIPGAPLNGNSGSQNGFKGLKQSNFMLYLGIGVIGFGVFIMLNELDLIFFPVSLHTLTSYSRRLFFPILLIAIGLLLIYSYRNSPIKQNFDSAINGLHDFQKNLTGDKRLYRSRTDRKLLGVCGGIGEYLRIDVSIIRIVFVSSLILTTFFGIIAYFVAALIIPEKPIEKISDNEYQSSQENSKSTYTRGDQL